MFEEAIHERRRYYQVGHQNMSRMHIRHKFMPTIQVAALHRRSGIGS